MAGIFSSIVRAINGGMGELQTTGAARQYARARALGPVTLAAGATATGERVVAAMSHDGCYLAYASGANCAVVSLIAQNRVVTYSFSGAKALTALAFSPDGLHVCAADAGGQAVVWERATRAVAQVWSVGLAGIDSLEWSSDGERLRGCRCDIKDGRQSVSSVSINWRTGNKDGDCGHMHRAVVNKGALSPGKRLMATAQDPMKVLVVPMDASAQAEPFILSSEEPVERLVWRQHPDERLLLCWHAREVSVWDVHQRACVRRLPHGLETAGSAYALFWNARGDLFLVSCEGVLAAQPGPAGLSWQLVYKGWRGFFTSCCADSRLGVLFGTSLGDLVLISKTRREGREAALRTPEANVQVWEAVGEPIGLLEWFDEGQVGVFVTAACLMVEFRLEGESCVLTRRAALRDAPHALLRLRPPAYFDAALGGSAQCALVTARGEFVVFSLGGDGAFLAPVRVQPPAAPTTVCAASGVGWPRCHVGSKHLRGTDWGALRADTGMVAVAHRPAEGAVQIEVFRVTPAPDGAVFSSVRTFESGLMSDPALLQLTDCCSFVAAYSRGSLCLWSIEFGDMVGHWNGLASLSCLNFTLDGAYLLGGDAGGRLVCWHRTRTANIPPRKITLQLSKKKILFVARLGAPKDDTLERASTLLVAGMDGSAHVVDCAEEWIPLTLPSPDIAVDQPAWLADGVGPPPPAPQAPQGPPPPHASHAHVSTPRIEAGLYADGERTPGRPGAHAPVPTRPEYLSLQGDATLDGAQYAQGLDESRAEVLLFNSDSAYPATPRLPLYREPPLLSPDIGDRGS